MEVEVDPAELVHRMLWRTLALDDNNPYVATSVSSWYIWAHGIIGEV